MGFPVCYEGCLGQSPSRKRHILADAIPGRTRELPCVQQHLNGISRQFQCVEKGNETWIWFENTRCGWEPTLLSLTTTHESNSPSEGCSSMFPAEILEKNVSVSAWPGYHQDGTGGLPSPHFSLTSPLHGIGLSEIPRLSSRPTDTRSFHATNLTPVSFARTSAGVMGGGAQLKSLNWNFGVGDGRRTPPGVSESEYFMNAELSFVYSQPGSRHSHRETSLIHIPRRSGPQRSPQAVTSRELVLYLRYPRAWEADDLAAAWRCFAGSRRGKRWMAYGTVGIVVLLQAVLVNVLSSGS